MGRMKALWSNGSCSPSWHMRGFWIADGGLWTVGPHRDVDSWRANRKHMGGRGEARKAAGDQIGRYLSIWPVSSLLFKQWKNSLLLWGKWMISEWWCTINFANLEPLKILERGIIRSQEMSWKVNAVAQTANTGKGLDYVVLAEMTEMHWRKIWCTREKKYEDYSIRYLDMRTNYRASWEQR